MAPEARNPIISGFSPDPSIVLVDGVFFVVNSSFHMFPGLPIYASRNLKSWTHIGNAINRRSQLSLQYAFTKEAPLSDNDTFISTGGLLAPTIRYHDGTFYIVCTNIVREGASPSVRSNFLVHTRDIWLIAWSDPVPFDFYGIDPSLFFDEDGRVYVQGCHRIDFGKQPSCTILQFEIDLATGKPLSEHKEIWSGFAKIDSEGPHVYKKDGFYYLLIAEGGTFEHHMISIARSRSVWGLYESYEKNPLLTADGTDAYIQHTGHGDLFQDQQGNWWAVLLAVRDNDSRFPMGRETFLTAVDWPEGEWPVVHTVLPVVCSPAPVLPEDDGVLKLGWTTPPRVEDLYIRDPVLANYRFGAPGVDEIVLTASEETLSTPNATASFLGRRQRELDSVATACLRLDGVGKGSTVQAGLSVYKDHLRHVDIFYDFGAEEICLCFDGLAAGTSQSAKVKAAPTGTLELQLRATAALYTFFWRRQPDEDWHSLGNVDTKHLTAKDFTGTIFGVFACNQTANTTTEIMFEKFDIK